ncbi:FbpB family small basic protein [Priestia sp. YIM B13446]
MFKQRKSFEELVKENKQALLKDKKRNRENRKTP